MVVLVIKKRGFDRASGTEGREDLVNGYLTGEADRPRYGLPDRAARPATAPTRMVGLRGAQRARRTRRGRKAHVRIVGEACGRACGAIVGVFQDIGAPLRRHHPVDPSIFCYN